MTDGGPAFPRATYVELDQAEYRPNQPSRGAISGDDGMSLRDYFAAKALVGILSVPDPRTCPKDTPFRDWQAELAFEDARTCYAYADAMLAVREKKGAQ